MYTYKNLKKGLKGSCFENLFSFILNLVPLAPLIFFPDSILASQLEYLLCFSTKDVTVGKAKCFISDFR